MATFSNLTMVDRLFKWMFGKARGDNNSQYFEENITTSFDVHASEVYAQPIPSTPPTTTNSIIKKWYDTDGDGVITLTRDRKVNGGRCWVAVSTWSANWSSGSADLNLIMKNFISPKYGKNYVVQILDGNDNPIPELDNSSWLFDYKAGVLTFETDRPETGNTLSDSIKIKIYQYIGQMLDQFSNIPISYKETFKILTNDETEFILKKTPSNLDSVEVYFNGMFLDSSIQNDFVLEGNKITLNAKTIIDDFLVVKYT